MINQDVEEKLEKMSLELAKIDAAERVLNKVSVYSVESSIFFL